MNFLSADFLQMLLRFVICMVVNYIIVDKLYYPKGRRRDFYFTYIMTSIAVFFLMFFMMDMKAKATMGIGIGLFGIFSIMRFRTDAMPVREMTYLFLIISLSVISAIVPTSKDDGSIDLTKVLELLITDALVIFISWGCECLLKVKSTKLIQYDRIELATPERYPELLEDLKKRTGLDIIKAEVGGMDFLRDSVVIKIFYNPPVKETSNSVNEQFKLRNRELRDM